MGTPNKSLTEKEEEIKEEYLKTLQDLTFNSKPLIDVLTEVAEENKEYASTITDCIVEQLEKVADPLKLPILYLIDSIIKNISQHYRNLFCKNIDGLFTKVYEQGDENVRNRLLKLRFTWNGGILPSEVLSSLDRKVQAVNPMWPTTSSIHVNPKFVSISTHATIPNGNVTTTAQTPTNPPPAFRIAPVSSQLINAAKRVRDPRLRKIELQQIRPPSNNSAGVNKESKTSSATTTTTTATTTATATTTTSAIEPIIDSKNDKKSSHPDVREIKARVKDSTKIRMEVKVEKQQPESSAAKSSKSRSETKTTKKKDKPTKISELFNELVRDDKKPVSKVWSKEERYKGLKAIANALNKDKDRDTVMENLLQNYPKVAQRLDKLMKEDGEDAHKEKKCDSTSRSSKSADKRDKTASPKPSSTASTKTSAKTSPSKPSTSAVPTSTVVVADTSPSKDSEELSPQIASPSNSNSKLKKSQPKFKTPIVDTISRTSSVSPPIPSPVVPTSSSAPVAEHASISTSISAGSAVIPEPMEIVVPATSIPSPIPTPPPAPVTTTIAISVAVPNDTVTRSVPVTAPIAISASVPDVPSIPSPTLPIPPPAPIISSNAENAKNQDIDYRQIFGFQQLLKVSPVVAEEKSKSEAKLEEPEITEIIDLDELPPSIPRKRKHQERKYRGRNKRRRTNSSSSCDSSGSGSREITFKRRKAEVDKISEDENSRGDEIKKSKVEGSFYSQNASVEESNPTSNLTIMDVSESVRAASKSPPMFPKFDSNFGANLPSSEYGSTQSVPEIPPTDYQIVKIINEDPVKSTKIDNVPREIRHYGSTAVVFLRWDDPREISFFNGVRNVIIDDKFGIPCSLNAPEVETLVYGKTHRFRLGAPTRELYVDGKGYECHFGEKSIEIELGGTIRSVKLEGPRPSVNISSIKRLDLVAGKIHIIINEELKYPIFLDAKPQIFLIEDKPLVLMFIDGLKRVLINNVPFRTDFGGPSQSFKVMNKVYDFRFTVLPLEVKPGINLTQMIVSKLPSPPPLPPQFQYSVTDNMFPPLPMPPVLLVPPIAPVVTPVVPVSVDSETPAVTSQTTSASLPAPGGLLENISIDELFQKLVASGIVPNVESKQEDGDDGVKFVDFKKPETLKQRQPSVIKTLYSGIQCGSCGLRFPVEQTLKYSEHLDWHFRLNRKGKDGARTIHSRKWYYSVDDWTKFQEMEDNSDRGSSWFDNHLATEYTEEILEDVPCVPAGANPNAVCELCRDRFEQFYNDESDEWQLKNAVKIDDLIYHPICYQDHEEKLKNETVEPDSELPIVVEPSVEDTVAEKTEPSETETPLEYDSDSDSDIEEVQLIEQPIEEIVIPDDGNDFDEPNLETLNTEDIIAAQQEIVEDPVPVIEARSIKVEEPDKIVDITDTANDPEPVMEEPEEIMDRSPQPMSGPECLVTMDGNIELVDSPAHIVSGSTRIKINITKNHSEDKANSPKVNDTTESVMQDAYVVASCLKDRVKDTKLTVYPAVTKGIEKSGLCSIM